MDEEELAWMRRVGKGVRDLTAKPKRIGLLDIFDRMATFNPCRPKQLPA